MLDKFDDWLDRHPVIDDWVQRHPKLATAFTIAAPYCATVLLLTYVQHAMHPVCG